MDIKDIQSQAAERIWLFPGEHDGETTLLWGDDPAPGEGMDASEAVEYVRKDVADARIAELERERDAYRTAEEHQIALRQKIEHERDALAAHADLLADNLQASINGIEWYRNNTSVDWGEADDEHLKECVNAIEQSPSASLARRDSLKQREAVLEMANDLAHEFNDKQLEIIRKRAALLGQNAEAQQ